MINSTYDLNDKGMSVYTELKELSELVGLLWIDLGRDTGFDDDLLYIGDVIFEMSNYLVLISE